ncbi:hypothetical protein CAL7716_056960 [Calothrix sp. PCC 7716]|nr:hypothetical protein CAL7716_056960 [Calothrix sp. PCC 7716]
MADAGKLKILIPKVKQAVSQIIFLPKSILLHVYIHLCNYYDILSTNQDKLKLKWKHIKNSVLGAEGEINKVRQS